MGLIKTKRLTDEQLLIYNYDCIAPENTEMGLGYIYISLSKVSTLVNTLVWTFFFRNVCQTKIDDIVKILQNFV